MAHTDSEHLKVSYEDTHKVVVKACSKVVNDKYIPDVLIGISTGGLIVVRIAKSCLEQDFGKKGIPTYVIGMSHYDNNNNRISEPIITQMLDSNLEKKIEGKKVLMFDEVDDSRRTLEKATDYILGLKAKELRILVAYMKDVPKNGKLPDNVKLYYGKKIPPKWIDYPWESKELF